MEQCEWSMVWATGYYSTYKRAEPSRSVLGCESIDEVQLHSTDMLYGKVITVNDSGVPRYGHDVGTGNSFLCSE